MSINVFISNIKITNGNKLIIVRKNGCNGNQELMQKLNINSKLGNNFFDQLLGSSSWGWIGDLLDGLFVDAWKVSDEFAGEAATSGCTVSGRPDVDAAADFGQVHRSRQSSVSLLTLEVLLQGVEVNLEKMLRIET